MAFRPVRDEARARAHSFTARLEVVVFAATLASALALAWVSLQAIRSFLREQLAADTQTTARASHNAIEVWIAGATADAARFGALLDAAETSAARSEPERAIRIARITGALGGSEFVSGLTVTDASGHLMLESGRLALTAERAQAVGAIDRPTLRSLGDDEDTTVVLSIPLRRPDHEHHAGVLHATLRTEWLAGRLDELADGHALQIAVVDPEGRTIVRRPPTAAEIEDSSATAVSDFETGGTTWRVIVRADPALAILRFSPLMRRTVLVQLVIAMVASLAALFASSSLMQPIRALSEAARRLRDGEEDVPLPELDRQDEVGVLTRTFAEMVRKAAEARIELDQRQRELEASHAEMLARNAELHQANEVLEQLAITDGLTRIHNHRFFQDQLTREVKRADRTGAPLSLLVIDLDDFKRFNDVYGHETGDEVLQRMAEVLVEETRDAELVARYGGEEFVVLASDTDLEGAAALAEKLRLAVHLRPLELSSGGEPPRVTVSIGVAEYAGDRSRLFRDADRALYDAKAAGKDCVVVATRKSAPEGTDPAAGGTADPARR